MQYVGDCVVSKTIRTKLSFGQKRTLADVVEGVASGLVKEKADQILFEEFVKRVSQDTRIDFPVTEHIVRGIVKECGVPIPFIRGRGTSQSQQKMMERVDEVCTALRMQVSAVNVRVMEAEAAMKLQSQQFTGMMDHMRALELRIAELENIHTDPNANRV